ncbi:MAG: nickel pincer cofactor biosynthesis protein LarC [Lachnospiraceae bacterium]
MNENNKALYLECYSGISGDMTVGALLDLGADKEELQRQIKTLPLGGYSIEISRVIKSGLDCCDFHVVLDEEYENHDHDIEYLYGHKEHGHEHGHEHNHEHEHSHDHSHEHNHEHGHSHEHSHEHNHEHGHSHDHNHEHTHHEHRGLHEVLEIIRSSEMKTGAKKIAEEIFYVLAEAEAKAHGSTIDQVHFHEVGAVDSIVDIAAAAICLDNLAVSEVIVPELYEGKGTVRCAHGILPVPVPAVMNIASAHGITLHLTNTEAELVTPTGAAIVAAVCTTKKLPKEYRVIASGMGAGKRDYGRASILRAMLIEKETVGGFPEDVIYKLESNIDDCTGEMLGYVMDRLFENGARDVSYSPVFMKKNRPAYQINVICSEDKVALMQEILFKETTTIGVRRCKMERSVLKRKIDTVRTSLGDVQVKLCEIDGEIVVYPEYESVAALAKEHHLPYKSVWKIVSEEAENARL